MPALVYAVDNVELAPFEMPDRFRHDITYFATPAGQQNVPDDLGEREFWVRREDALQMYDDGVIVIVSPLDSESRTEIEITEEQEVWLEWMNEHEIEDVRID